MTWDVNNPKGRIASILSVILWLSLIILLFLKGDYSIGPLLAMILFILLLILSFVRIVQEWKEDGEWLD